MLECLQLLLAQLGLLLLIKGIIPYGLDALRIQLPHIFRLIIVLVLIQLINRLLLHLQPRLLDDPLQLLHIHPIALHFKGILSYYSQMDINCSYLLSLPALLLQTSKHPFALLAVEQVEDAVVGVLSLKGAEDLADEGEFLLGAESALQLGGQWLAEEDGLSSDKGLLVGA